MTMEPQYPVDPTPVKRSRPSKEVRPKEEESYAESRSPSRSESRSESSEGICPYFTRERSHGVVTCECARLKFPDRDSRREIVYRYCAHPEGYKACMLKQALDHYYERKYARHE